MILVQVWPEDRSAFLVFYRVEVHCGIYQRYVVLSDQVLAIGRVIAIPIRTLSIYTTSVKSEVMKAAFLISGFDIA